MDANDAWTEAARLVSELNARFPLNEVHVWGDHPPEPEPKNHSSPSSAKHRSAASRGHRFISPGAHEGYEP